MQNYIHTDLALESAEVNDPSQASSPEFSEKEVCGVKISILDISTERLSEKYSRPIGRYVSVTCDKIWLMSDSELNASASVIGDELSKMIADLIHKEKTPELSALVVGLGNADVTPDAIGPMTVSRLTVTRHIARLDSKFFSRIGQCAVSAFIPGVLAQTGIETIDLIKGAVQSVCPDVVIAVDALAARSCERLASTVQISSAGIVPGSGIGNIRKAINRDTLGIPVVAIGVPTVVDSATLVYDALERSGIYDIPKELHKVLKNDRSFFVSPKECDVISDSVSVLLANAIDFALRVI